MWETLQSVSRGDGKKKSWNERERGFCLLVSMALCSQVASVYGLPADKFGIAMTNSGHSRSRRR